MQSAIRITHQWVSAASRTRNFIALVGGVVLIHLLCSSVLWPVKVLGNSMEPTFDSGTHHYVNKLAYWGEKPKRGDVVTLRVREGEVFIKRIVGMPGETVGFKAGKLTINGEPVPEFYTDSTVPWTFEPVKVSKDCYFVIGDNRATSVLGMIPSERIIGKVIF